jgi:hypothetical protein
LPIHNNSLFNYLDLASNPKHGRVKKITNLLNTMTTLETTIQESYDWAIDRIHTLSEENIEDAHAIQSEFGEWLNPDILEHDIFSLEFIGEEDDPRSS